MGLAAILPGLWAPLIFVSIGLMMAAFVMAIMVIVKGKPLAGALLIAACPFVAFIAFAMIGIQDEVRKQRSERDEGRSEAKLLNEARTKHAAPAEKWVRLTVDTQLSAEEKQIQLVAGQRLKVLEKHGRYYAVEYEGGRYMIPIGVTKAD